MALLLVAHAHARGPPLLAADLNLETHITLSATSAVVALQTTIVLVTESAHTARPRNAGADLPEEVVVVDIKTRLLPRAPKGLDLVGIELVLHRRMRSK